MIILYYIHVRDPTLENRHFRDNFSEFVSLDFRYLNEKMNGLAKFKPCKLSHVEDTSLESW